MKKIKTTFHLTRQDQLEIVHDVSEHPSEVGWVRTDEFDSEIEEKRKAAENFKRASDDLSLSRFDIQKAEAFFRSKQNQFETAKQSYAADLSKFNSNQRRYFMHACLDLECELEVENRIRTKTLRNVFLSACDIEERLSDVIRDLNTAVRQVAEAIDADKDGDLTVVRFSRGDSYPIDLPFLDLDACPPHLLSGPPDQLANYLTDCAYTQNTNSGSAQRGSLAASATAKDSVLRSAFINSLGLIPGKIETMTIKQTSDRICLFKEFLANAKKDFAATEMANLKSILRLGYKPPNEYSKNWEKLKRLLPVYEFIC